MSPFDKQHTAQEETNKEWKVAELPAVDNGYYDTLTAIGFAALPIHTMIPQTPH
jgi:hypothetical protein